MTNSKTILLSLILISLSACSESTIDFENLVERGGVYYEKFSTEPFSGRVTGLTTGTLVDGRFEGPVYFFNEDGNLFREANYKGGVPDGLQTTFDFPKRFESEISMGTTLAYREFVHDVLIRSTPYRDGMKHGVQEHFYSNGNLKYRVNYSDGAPVEGVIDVFSRDGTTHLKVPVSKEQFGYLVPDGVVEKVGEFPCMYLYDKGVARGRVRKTEQSAPSMPTEDRIRCGIEIERLISEAQIH